MPLSAGDKITIERIVLRAHDTGPRMAAAAKEMAEAILELCPDDGMERSSALSHLEETLLWARAGAQGLET